MKKLKKWQIVLLIIFYPIGIIYLIYWLYQKIIKEKTVSFSHKSENVLPTLPNSVGVIPLAYNYNNESICFMYGRDDTEKLISLAKKNVGKYITFRKEPENSYDEHAVAIYLDDVKLGYVYRDNHQGMINGWLDEDKPIIAFINGYIDDIVNYTIGFYKEKSANPAFKSTSVETFKKVNFFTKKWQSALNKEFVVLDFETTGLSHNTDRIIEISAIKYTGLTETDKFTTLVNPQMKIPSSSVKVHRITDEMVSSAPIESTAIPQLVKFLGNSLLVGHNISFDLRFLSAAMKRCKLNPTELNYIDTLDISRKIFPNAPNHKLATICEIIEFIPNDFHRAETDCIACTELVKFALSKS